jgi:hypothetical protein
MTNPGKPQRTDKNPAVPRTTKNTEIPGFAPSERALRTRQTETAQESEL